MRALAPEGRPPIFRRASANQSLSILPPKANLPHEQRHPLSRTDLLAVRRNHKIAVRARKRSDVTGPLPASQLNLEILEFAGQHGRQKTLQACLCTHIGFESGL